MLRILSLSGRAVIAAAIAALLIAPVCAAAEQAAAVRPEAKARAAQVFDLSPAVFVENKGQWDKSVRYGFDGKGARVSFTDSGPVFQMLEFTGEEGQRSETLFSARFVGARPVRPVGLDPCVTRVNYYHGSDPSRWQSDVPTFRKVAYKELYDGVDLHTWGKRSALKYEFHVAPGASWKRIVIRYEGIEALSLDGNGALHVRTPYGGIVDQAPAAYQETLSGRVEVRAAFRLIDAASYGFQVIGAYEPDLPLVIDPELAWGTYLGGGYDDEAYGIAADGSGSVYVVGKTLSVGFPVQGATQPLFGDSSGQVGDAFVARIGTDGHLVWATYLGGSGAETGYGISVDASSHAYVTGQTASPDFPTRDDFQTALRGSRDAFVAKFSSSGHLVWSSYLGGAEAECGQSVAIDSSSDAWLTGWTESGDFPVSGGFDTELSGTRNAFVARVTSSGQLAWASYLGGSVSEWGNAIALDAVGNAFVAGETQSADFPVSGGFDTTYNGSEDAFIAKMTPSGQLAWASYLGGAFGESANAVAADKCGNVWVAGVTCSLNFPTVNAFDNDLGYLLNDAFVAKISPTCELLLSSYLGGDYGDGASALCVDVFGDAYLTGTTESADFPASNGFDTGYHGWQDAFVAKVTAAGQLAWGSYLGGSFVDWGAGIAVDGAGGIWVAGGTRSGDLPTPGGFDTSHSGSDDPLLATSDAFVVKIAQGPVTGVDDLAITASQRYDATSTVLTLSAHVQDPLFADVTAGAFGWALHRGDDSTVTSGNMTYDQSAGCWAASAAIPTGLPDGVYAVHYEILTDHAKTGSLTSELIVGAVTRIVQGTISDVAAKAPLEGASVAIFNANSLWKLASMRYHGIVPPLTTLLSQLKAVRGPVTTGADGAYAWSDLTPGGPYVIVAAKVGYAERYSPSFPLAASSEPLTVNLTLGPLLGTMAVLFPQVDDLAEACESVLDYNAGLMGALSAKANADALYEDITHADTFSKVADCISWLNPDADAILYSGKIGGVAYETVAAHLAAVTLRNAIDELPQEMATSLESLVLANLTDRLSFPSTAERYLGSNYHQTFLSDIRAGHVDFRSRATGITPNGEFSVEFARQLLQQARQGMNEARAGGSPFIALPSASDGVARLKLLSMSQLYGALSNRYRDTYAAETALSFVQVLGTGVAVGSFLTGAGAPVGATASTLTTVAGYAKTGIQLYRVPLSSQMAHTFIETTCGTYPEDNGIVQKQFGAVLRFLEEEAGRPRYLRRGMVFNAHAKIDLNLPFGLRVMYVHGEGNGEAIVTATNRGNTNAILRIAARSVYCPRGGEEATTSMGTFSTGTLAAGATQILIVPFRGYDRSLINMFAPHYLQADVYSGPFKMWRAVEQYRVLGFGGILPAANAGATPAARTSRSIVAAAVSARGRMPMAQALRKVLESRKLTSTTLSAAKPALVKRVKVGGGLYAVDLRLFAAVDSAVSILVTDQAGRRLGYSSVDGVTYSEFLGEVADQSEGLTAVRILQPLDGAVYRITISLLSPGPGKIPVTLFYEPVSRSGAVMTAFPSPVIVDATRGSDETLLMRIGEGSEQQALTGVAATLSTLTGPGSDVLTAADDAARTVGDVAAGRQQYAWWSIPCGAEAQLGKYTGTVKLTSNETADMTVPVVALIRESTETISDFEGQTGSLRKSLKLGRNGRASTWVRVPNGFKVVHAAVGAIGGSGNLRNPKLDIGADGVFEWSFSGRYRLGVLVDNLEDALNAYISSHEPGPDGWDVPIAVRGTPGQSLVLDGLRVYLENAAL